MFPLYKRKVGSMMYSIKFLDEFYDYKAPDRYLMACKFGCAGPEGKLELFRTIWNHFQLKHKDVHYNAGLTKANQSATETKVAQYLTDRLLECPCAPIVNC